MERTERVKRSRAAARRWVVLPALVPALVAALVLGGCGGDGGGNGVASLSGGATTTTGGVAGQGGDERDRMVKYTQCMRQHGVQMPDPDEQGRVTISAGGPGGPPTAADQKRLEAAEKACQPLAGAPRRSPEEDQRMQERLLAMSKCMREHGIDMPDPEVKEGRGLMRLPKGVDPQSKRFQQAQRECSRKTGLDLPPGKGAP